MLSIAHRGSGVFLALGTPLLIYWLLAVAQGGAAFAETQAFYGSVFGRLILFGWTFALFYHLCNGIRHLAWDIGFGFELKELYRSGWAVLLVTVIMTMLVWWIGYQVRGGV